MKRKYIVRITLLIFVAAVVFTACTENAGKDSHAGHSKAQQYTCPMHPQIVQDKPGKCPICGMDLVPMSSNNELRVDSTVASLTKPVNERIIATIPTISPESGTRIFSVPAQGIIAYDTRKQTNISSRVSGRIEKLFIKYNFQPVKQGQLIMEIYSPDLAAAQRELIFVARAGDEDLVQKAKQRLSLLGMPSSQISHVLKTGNILYRVPVYSNASGYILEKGVNTSPVVNTAMLASSASGSDDMNGMSLGASQATIPLQAPPMDNNTPVLIREGQYVSAGQSLFTVYQSGNLVAEFAFRPAFAAEIRKGDKLVFRPNASKNDVHTGTIGLIEPVLRGGQNFTLARVYLTNTSLRPGELIGASIPVTSRGWWLPAEAVWKTGARSIVFKKENDAFIPVEIRTGIEAEGMIQIITGIVDWEIAKNASFLVDSESFIKTKTIQD